MKNLFKNNIIKKINSCELDLKQVQNTITEKGWYNAIYWNYHESAFTHEYNIELYNYILENDLNTLEKVLKFLNYEKEKLTFNDKNKYNLEILQMKVLNDKIYFFKMHTEIFN